MSEFSGRCLCKSNNIYCTESCKCEAFEGIYTNIQDIKVQRDGEDDANDEDDEQVVFFPCVTKLCTSLYVIQTATSVQIMKMPLEHIDN